MLVVMLESFGLDTMIWSPWNYNPVGPAMNHPPNAAAVPPKSSWAREENSESEVVSESDVVSTVSGI